MKKKNLFIATHPSLKTMAFFEAIQNFISGITPEKIIQFIIDPQFSGWLLIVRNFFIGLSLFFLGFIIFVFIKTTWLKRMVIWDLHEFLTHRPFETRKAEKEWKITKNKLATEMESEWKLAVIEADKMTDSYLSQMGFGGANLGERLKKLDAAHLPNIEELKEAYKIRNNIIHDPTYKLSLEEAKKALEIYEKALADLHVL